MKIKRVSELEMLGIIIDKKPIGLFYSKYEGIYTACNNLNGEAIIEPFETLEECKNYLKKITNK